MNLFKRNIKADPRRSTEMIIDGRRKGEGQNPYLNARRTWNDHTRQVVAARQTWQMLGILSLLVVLAAVGGILYIGSQSRFIPYVVEVDKLGQAVAAGPVTATLATDPRIIKASVAEFVSLSRMVTPDISLQRKAVLKVYALLSTNDPATEKMNEWLNSVSPFKRAETEMVSIDIRSVLPQTASTWQVDWLETTRDRQGVVKDKPKNWRALVTVYTAENTPQTTEEQVRLNPLGIYIRDFSWSVLQ